MEFIFTLISSQTVIAFIQLLIGKWLKANPKIPNTIIPILTFLAALLGYSVMPATATAASFLTPVAPGLSLIGMALFQNFLVTGVHSTFKNTVLPAFKVGLLWAANAVQKNG